MISYTGIGSRQTPQRVCLIMGVIANRLELEGYLLRSGGARGADSAFEMGVQIEGNKQIFLPCKFFNKNHSRFFKPTENAISMAARLWATHHDKPWEQLPDLTKKLHARNCHQVLGLDLKSPSKFVICWTPRGQLVGGTRIAINLATENNIPVYNLGSREYKHLTLEDFIETLLA